MIIFIMWVKMDLFRKFNPAFFTFSLLESLLFIKWCSQLQISQRNTFFNQIKKKNWRHYLCWFHGLQDIFDIGWCRTRIRKYPIKYKVAMTLAIQVVCMQIYVIALFLLINFTLSLIIGYVELYNKAISQHPLKKMNQRTPRLILKKS